MLGAEPGIIYLKDAIDEAELLFYLGTHSFNVMTQKNRDVFVKVSEDNQDVFSCVEKCFNEITECYESKSVIEKEMYESIWFVDKYNQTVTFYSDTKPNDQANSFIIRKFENDNSGKYYEIGIFHNKGNFHNRVTLYNRLGGGQYCQYYGTLEDLYLDLSKVFSDKSLIIEQENEESKQLIKN